MKLFKILLSIFILALFLTGCVSDTVYNFDDYQNTAQENAEQMAEDLMENMQDFQSLAPDFGNTDLSTYNAYTVIRVVDGDTFMLNIDGVETKVRLIGIDTPESVATGKNAYKNCEEGKQASDFTKSLIEGKPVYIEYDVDPEDDYGRKLVYAYLEDGTMLNKLLLEKGYARTMTIQPNSKYANDFVEIQTIARNNKVGFWDGFETWQEN